MTSRARPLATPADAEAFFADSPLGAAAFRRIHSILAAQGPCDLRVARTQVGWARHRGFAFLWRPGRWLRNPGADVVLTVALPRRDPSPRWKQVVEPRPGSYVHHLELHDIADLDAEVEAWLAESYEAAG